MREVTGDLWEQMAAADALCIPVNWTTKRNGEAVMGAGVAKQAAARWPDLPRVLGEQIRRSPDVPHVPVYAMGGWWLVCLPTKRHWRDAADIGLVMDGAADLIYEAGGQNWQTVVMPRLGCGLGGLNWESQVRPLLAGILDDRFVVVSQPPVGGARGDEG